MTEIVKSPQFDADIEALWLRIARRHPPTADSIVASIEDKIELAAEFPRMGTPVPHLAPDLRRLSSGPFLIHYRLNGEVLQVLRVLYGRRKITPDDIL